MKVLLLSNNDNVKALYDAFLAKGCDVTLYHDAVTPDFIKEFGPDLVVSYNYQHIVKKDVIDMLGNRIVNLHCSYLPWNKGASPNLWSFIEDSPKGVTIHRLEAGLDTGKIIVQKEVSFDEEADTLASSYNKLNAEIVELFMENFDYIASGEYKLIDQEGEGSYHTSAMLRSLLDGENLDYNMTIAEFKEHIRKLSQ